MKKNAGLLLIGILLLKSFTSLAQTYAESALLYSRQSVGGSARIQAMGGAQVSLGGDYSSAFSNPAGLGMYNRSEFTITPGFSSSNTSSTYINNTTSDGQSKVIIPGVSMVFYKKSNSDDDESKLKFLGGSFGVSVNRTNNFNSSFTYNGVNKNTSLLDYFANDANSSANAYHASGPTALFYQPGYIYESPTRLAWDNYLLNTASPTDSTHYVTDITGIPTQREKVQTSGSQNQINLSYGANFSDWFFIGGGIGVAMVSYKSSKFYSETFGNGPLSSFSLDQNLSSSAIGINATLGTIIKPLDFFQVGLSIATPTYYSFSDNYGATINSNWSNFPYTPASPPGPASTDIIQSKYNLTTPWRFNGGVTFFVQKHGFISADIEYLDYANSKYGSKSSNPIDFSGDNSDIKTLYTKVINVRIGGEYRLNNYRVRAGYSFKPDPYIQIQNSTNNQLQSYSVGAGYRTSKFFIDVAGIYSTGNTTYIPYTSAPVVSTKNTNTTIMVTVGFPIKR